MMTLDNYACDCEQDIFIHPPEKILGLFLQLIGFKNPIPHSPKVIFQPYQQAKMMFRLSESREKV